MEEGRCERRGKKRELEERRREEREGKRERDRSLSCPILAVP